MPALTSFSKHEIADIMVSRIRAEADEVLRLRQIIKEVCRAANDVTISEDHLRELIFAKTKEALKTRG